MHIAAWVLIAIGFIMSGMAVANEGFGLCFWLLLGLAGCGILEIAGAW